MALKRKVTFGGQRYEAGDRILPAATRCTVAHTFQEFSPSTVRLICWKEAIN